MTGQQDQACIYLVNAPVQRKYDIKVVSMRAYTLDCVLTAFVYRYATTAFSFFVKYIFSNRNLSL